MYDSTWNYVGIWMNWFGCGHGREQMDGATLAQCAKQLALAGGEAPQISSAVSFWRKHSECEKGCTQIWLFITIRPVYTCIYPIRQTRLSLGSKQNQGDFLESAVNTWLVCHTFFLWQSQCFFESTLENHRQMTDPLYVRHLFSWDQWGGGAAIGRLASFVERVCGRTGGISTTFQRKHMFSTSEYVFAFVVARLEYGSTAQRMWCPAICRIFSATAGVAAVWQVTLGLSPPATCSVAWCIELLELYVKTQRYSARLGYIGYVQWMDNSINKAWGLGSSFRTAHIVT